MRTLVLTCAALLIAAPTGAATTYTGNGGQAPGFKIELDRRTGRWAWAIRMATGD